MKIYIFIGALFLSLTTIAQKMATIVGVTTQEKPATVKLYKVVEGATREVASTVPSKTGIFGFNFYPDAEGLYLIGTGTANAPQNKFKFWLKPGDKLSFKMNDTSYTLQGAFNTKENVALANWFKLSNNLFQKSIYADPNGTYDDFYSTLNQLVNKSKNWEKTQVTGNLKFDNALKQITAFDKAFYAINFMSMPKMYNVKMVDPPAYYNGFSVNSYFPTAQAMYSYPWGQSLFNTFLYYDLNRKYKEDNARRKDPMLVYTVVNSDTLKGELTLSKLNEIKNYADYINYKTAVEENLITDSQKEREFQLLATKATLQEGDPGYNFKYEDINGKQLSFADLKGKVVLIDVWATWCGPCKAEIPHLKKLEEEMHNKNIAFVSITVDVEKDKNKWKEMVAEKELGGIQLFANGWSEIAKYYKINGIPRFMVFDKEGKIVTVEAPRPSSPDLKPLLEKYL